MLRDNKGRFVKGNKPHNRSTMGLLRGINASNWRGGRRLKKTGYIEIHRPENPTSHKDGYILEHRLVMEKHLGRQLVKGEIVHHINGKRADNRIENLELHTNISSHIGHHHKLGTYDAKNHSQKGKPFPSS